MKNPCVDDVFGPKSKYRVTMDEAWEHEEGGLFGASEKPRLRRVRCNIGGTDAHLYVHGPTLVGYSGVGMVLRAKLLAIPKVQPHQTGDNEFTVKFPPEALSAVAKVVKPRTRRTLTDTQKAEGAARLAAYRFSKISTQPTGSQ